MKKKYSSTPTIQSTHKTLVIDNFKGKLGYIFSPNFEKNVNLPPKAPKNKVKHFGSQKRFDTTIDEMIERKRSAPGPGEYE
jgi:hypothetical protein